MRQRVERLRAKLKELKIDGYLVIEIKEEPVFIRYLTGSAVEGLLYINQEGSWLITDGRYQEQAEKEARVSEIVITSSVRGYVESLIEAAVLKPGEKISVEGKLSALLFQEYQKLFSSNELILLNDFAGNLAAIKDSREIAKIKKALEITKIVFEKHVLPEIKPGITEKSLAAEILYQALQYGAERDAFFPIVLSGPNSALPHGKAGQRKIRVGDIVQFDMGFF